MKKGRHICFTWALVLAFFCLNAHTTTINYDSWCQDWELSCKAPTEVPEITQKTWKSLADLGEVLHQTQSHLIATPDQLFSGELEDLLKSAGYFNLIKPFWELVEGFEWDSFELAPESGITLAGLEQEDAFSFFSGLLIRNTAEELKAAFSGGALKLSGLEIGSEAHGFNGLNAISMADSHFVFETQEATIAGIPFAFWFEEEMPDLQFIPLIKDMSKSLGKGAEWLIGLNAKIALDANFFDKLNEHHETLVSQMGDIDISKLLKKLGDVNVGSDNPLVQANLRPGVKKARCTMEQRSVILPGERITTEIKFSKSFGLQQIKVIDSENVEITCFGLNATAKISFIPISFVLKTINVGPEGMTIYDVPIVGEYFLPWEDMQDPKTGKMKDTVTCK